eukprot:scpid51463/ scgid35239/ 
MLFRLILLAGLLGYCSAALVGGRRTYMNYNSACGVWNDPTAGRGKILEECCPVDATYPGSPWQQLSVSYVTGGVSSQFSGNTGLGGCPSYQVLSEQILDDGSGTVGIEHVMRMGLLDVTKTETWDFDGKIVLITFKVKYGKDSFLQNCRPITNLTVMHAVDPDQDRQPFSTFQTINDVIFSGGLFAEAVGPRSCKTMGYGICANRHQDGSRDEVGFTRWVSTTPAILNDPGQMLRDDTMHYQHRELRPLHCGDEREFRFFAVWGRCHDEARANFRQAFSRFCRRCFRSPSRTILPLPRCLGRCPCTARNANCTCSYKCPRGIFSPTDITVATAEADLLLSRCSERKKRQAAVESEGPIPVDPSRINAEAFEAGDDDCATLRTERASLGSSETEVKPLDTRSF